MTIGAAGRPAPAAEEAKGWTHDAPRRAPARGSTTPRFARQNHARETADTVRKRHRIQETTTRATAVAAHWLRADARHIAECATCGFDLRKTQTVPCPEGMLILQGAADTVTLRGETECLGIMTKTREWFATTGFLGRLVRRAARTPTRGLERLLEAAGTTGALPLDRRAGASIERLGVDERAAILQSVAGLMALGSEGLRQGVEHAGLTRQG